jgi:outer membrane cobalamin receptor
MESILRQRLTYITILFALTVMPCSVHANDLEDPPVDDISAYKDLSLEELLALPVWNITTASKREEKSGAAPATVFVVTKDDIYLRGYSTLIDVLRDLPGMEIAEYVYAAIGTQVAVRGVLGNNKIIVLVNGMRVNPPGGDPMMFHSDFSVREAEQIEIVYGPGSTLYGQDAISAVINVKTKRSTGEHWIDIGVGAGYPWRQETWLGLNRKVGETEINGYVQYSDATLTDRSKEFPDEWATYLQPYDLVPGGAASMQNPKRWDKGLNAFLQLVQGGTSMQLWHRQSWRSSAEGRPGTLPFTESNKWSDVATVFEAKNIFKLASHVDLTSTITINRFELLPSSCLILPAGTSWIEDHKYSLETSAALEETVSAQLGERISLLGGFMWGHYDIIPQGTVPAGLNTSADVISQAGTYDYYTSQGDPTSKVSINKLSNPTYQNIGFYAEGTLKLDKYVQLLLGARLDKDTRYSELPVSPRAALIVDATSDLTLKAIYTQAYVAPAPYNMYDVYQTYWLNTVNLDLKPEKARSFEINAIFQRKNVFANFSAYYSIQNNLLLSGGISSDAALLNAAVYPSPDPSASPMLAVHDANGGTNHAYGADVFGRYSLSNNRASVWGSYSYVDSEMTNVIGGASVKSGLPGLAHHNFRLGGTVNILRDKLFATLGLWLRSDPQNLSDIRFGTTATTTLTGAAEWPYEISLNVIYRLSPSLETFATLHNLTDHHYATVYDTSRIPGETFRGILGLRFHR